MYAGEKAEGHLGKENGSKTDGSPLFWIKRGKKKKKGGGGKQHLGNELTTKKRKSCPFANPLQKRKEKIVSSRGGGQSPISHPEKKEGEEASYAALQILLLSCQRWVGGGKGRLRFSPLRHMKKKKKKGKENCTPICSWKPGDRRGKERRPPLWVVREKRERRGERGEKRIEFTAASLIVRKVLCQKALAYT